MLLPSSDQILSAWKVAFQYRRSGGLRIDTSPDSRSIYSPPISIHMVPAFTASLWEVLDKCGKRSIGPLSNGLCSKHTGSLEHGQRASVLSGCFLILSGCTDLLDLPESICEDPEV